MHRLLPRRGVRAQGCNCVRVISIAIRSSHQLPSSPAYSVRRFRQVLGDILPESRDTKRGKKRHAPCFVSVMHNVLLSALSGARDDLAALSVMAAIVVAFLVL